MFVGYLKLFKIREHFNRLLSLKPKDRRIHKRGFFDIEVRCTVVFHLLSSLHELLCWMPRIPDDTYGSAYVVFLQERLGAAMITVRGKKGIDWELIPAFLFFVLFLSFHIKLHKRKLLNNNVINTIVLIESFHCSAHTCRLRLTDHDIKHFWF